MQVLQIFSPMGHALGLSVVSARLDDLALTVLFGAVYSDMRDWMACQQRHWTSLLGGMQLQVQQALAACPQLAALGAVACVSTRAKSAYSLMKKLATLSGAPATCTPALSSRTAFAAPPAVGGDGRAVPPALRGCLVTAWLPDEVPACILPCMRTRALCVCRFACRPSVSGGCCRPSRSPLGAVAGEPPIYPGAMHFVCTCVCCNIGHSHVVCI